MGRRITDEEREERVNLVGEYITENPDVSVRIAAKHFQELGYSMSYVTVQNYIQRYKTKYPERSDMVQQIVDSRKPLTIEDDVIKERVLREANKVLEGYTLENISEMESVEYWTVVRDLAKRLPILDQNLYAQVAAILTQNSMNNLVHKETKTR